MFTATQMRVIENGKISWDETIEMPGITPEMLRRYQNQHSPMGKSDDDMRASYLMRHPDHIDFKVIHKQGGDINWAKERLGKYVVSFINIPIKSGSGESKVKGVIHKHLLYQARFDFLEEEWTTEGRISRTRITVGYNNPLWGRFWNFIIWKFIFTQSRYEAQIKHTSEEQEIMERRIKEFWDENYNEVVSL